MNNRARNDRGRRAALISRAEELLAACAVQRPPVNLIRIARHVGIQRIRELDVRLDGQLFELDDGSYEVVLSSQAPYVRRRFTLAHEIGHIVVAAQSGSIACGDGPTEELCNAVAAELLLPARLVSETLRHKITVSEIRQIATKFQCSLEATGWRILNLGAVKGVLLIWRDLGEGRIELAAAPRTYGLRPPFQIGDAVDRASPPMKKLLARESGSLEFKEPGTGRAYTGDYAQLNKTVLMFLRVVESTGGEASNKSSAAWAQGELF